MSEGKQGRVYRLDNLTIFLMIIIVALLLVITALSSSYDKNSPINEELWDHQFRWHNHLASIDREVAARHSEAMKFRAVLLSEGDLEAGKHRIALVKEAIHLLGEDTALRPEVFEFITQEYTTEEALTPIITLGSNEDFYSTSNGEHK